MVTNHKNTNYYYQRKFKFCLIGDFSYALDLIKVLLEVSPYRAGALSNKNIYEQELEYQLGAANVATVETSEPETLKELVSKYRCKENYIKCSLLRIIHRRCQK